MKYGKDIEKQTLLLTDKYKDFVQKNAENLQEKIGDVINQTYN